MPGPTRPASALFERNEAINQVTLGHELARRDRLEEMGGLAYLSRLVTELPTPVGVEHYARIVKRDAVYRRLIEVASRIAQMGYNGGPDLEETLARAESDAALASHGERLSDFLHIKDILDGFWEGPGPGIAARRARRQRADRLHGPGHAARRAEAVGPHHPRGATQPGEDEPGR